ncbi:MAG: hypothetical protein ACRDE2_16435, partial [Chitinophagaceae bacterium]
VISFSSERSNFPLLIAISERSLNLKGLSKVIKMDKIKKFFYRCDDLVISPPLLIFFPNKTDNYAFAIKLFAFGFFVA